MGSLTDDPDFRATTFVVIDFEATTPAGRPAQPIEVAALALRYEQGDWVEAGRFASLIRPPEFAPVTRFNTLHSGLTSEHLASAPAPADALGALDHCFTAGSRYLLVAQHAATEAGLLYNQREHCPVAARIDLLDTIPLARRLIPGLADYRLDTLLRHYSIPLPEDRHRAAADVRVTARVFRRLIEDADREGAIRGFAELVRVAGRRAKVDRPAQGELFTL
ncbi:PolC-type DNA polymerase III [Nocardiopsis alba]|uniref:3'-5' exonuclease n=1 Tax=Nocardiopsis alba TaxID=53437 RepID=UPI00366C46CF